MSIIPAKTFFLGEYLALVGGPALIGLTKPCFQVHLEKKLHPDCMAARFWQVMTNTTCDWGLDDPYLGKGGLGASTAEFLLAYQKIFTEVKDLTHLRKTYFQYAELKKPSGYDLLAQTSQGLVLVETNPERVQSFRWGFSEIGFILVHTGKKLPTHIHLREFNQDFAWQLLAKAAEKAMLALEGFDTELLISAMTEYAKTLTDLNLLATHSKDWLNYFVPQLPVLAAKGCGAMGSDTILLLARIEDIGFIVDKLHQFHQDVIATQQDLFLEKAKI